MSSVVNILLVDDHPMLRTGLSMLLNTHDDLQVVVEAGSRDESIEAVKTHSVDLAIVDYSLVDEKGSDVAIALLEINPELKILGISSFSTKSIITEMAQAGATGFVLKDADVHELLEAVRITAAGKNFFSRGVSTILLGDILANKPKPQNPGQQFACAPQDLTKRERDVLENIVGEKTNQEIADELYISKKTVENHRQNLMQKIGARNTAGIVKFALMNQLA